MSLYFVALFFAVGSAYAFMAAYFDWDMRWGGHRRGPLVDLPVVSTAGRIGFGVFFACAAITCVVGNYSPWLATRILAFDGLLFVGLFPIHLRDRREHKRHHAG